MIASAVVSSTDVAWITVAGTLGGVFVTGVFAGLTALLTQRSQYRRNEQEHRVELERELRSARRESYVRYILSAQSLFDRSVEVHIKNRSKPVDSAEFVLRPPQELADVLARNETCRVEVLLLAGQQVRLALENYDDQLDVFWKGVASGAHSDKSEAWKSEKAAYHNLLDAMRTELSTA